jgi:His-Xaa-Ser system protein HxsD
MKFENHYENNEIVVFADLKLYSRDGIFKCLYWYGDKYNVKIGTVEEGVLRIEVKPLSDEILSKEQCEILLSKLERDLIDFNLRDIVSKETKNIRELLIAKAFSNGDFDENPPGNISDPVGFNINDLTND